MPPRKSQNGKGRPVIQETQTLPVEPPINAEAEMDALADKVAAKLLPKLGSILVPQIVQQPQAPPPGWRPLPKIVACLPLYEMVYGEFAQSHKACLDGVAALMVHKGSYIPDSFNSLAGDALRQIPDVEWLFFFEQDMWIPPGTMELVRSYPPGSIVGAIYYGRAEDDQRPIPGSFDIPLHSLTRMTDDEVDAVMARPGLHQVDSVGTGATFVHADVFRRWNPNHPSFSSCHHEDYCPGGRHLPWFQTPPGPDVWHLMSQDVWFCWHAREQGFPIYVDSRIQAHHMGIHKYRYESYMGWREKAKAAQPNGGAPVPLTGNQAQIIIDAPELDELETLLAGLQSGSA